MAKLAFLGLGVMGFPMAGHLQKAGHSVTVYNRSAAKAAAWVAKHGYKSVRLVTADWHVPRAKLELANALGPDVEIHGDGVRTTASWSMLLREYHKYLVRRFALLFGIGNG